MTIIYVIYFIFVIMTHVHYIFLYTLFTTDKISTLLLRLI